ncbi:hypothetical protein HK102_009685 [Quaeritorhiza haematococci]|nr:hypothetical protein HK102_009685 [Quaeritorhiza haematococci]
MGAHRDELTPKLTPMFPVGPLTPKSECPHKGPIPEGSPFVCMVCHQSGHDTHPKVHFDPAADMPPDPIDDYEETTAEIDKSGQSAADSASRTGESPLYNLVFTTGEHAKMRIKPSAILRWSCAVVLCCIAITPTLGQGAAYCLSTNFSLSDTYAVVDPSPNGGYKVKAQTSYSFDCEDGELAACIACLLVEVFADTDGNGTYDRSVRQARSSSVYACGSTLNAGVFTADAFQAMAFGTTMKVLLLAMLAVATSSVLALSGKPPKSQPPARQAVDGDITTDLRENKLQGMGGDIVTDLQEGKAADVLDGEAARGGLTAIHGLKASVLDDAVHITGGASVSRIGRDAVYVWEARVRHPRRGAILGRQRYDAQAFQIPDGLTSIEVSFEDLIKLPLAPGSYDVELVLSKVPDQGVVLLDDPDVQGAHLLAKDTVSIKVGD